MVPGVEALGSIVLPSGPGVTLSPQTITLGATLTNFTALPLSPAVALFDPSLGTLTSVQVLDYVDVRSTVTAQNLSTTSATQVTVTITDGFHIDGFFEPLARPTQTVTSGPLAAGPFGSATDTVTDSPEGLGEARLTTMDGSNDVAFFTASPGRTTIVPTLTATASVLATAPNANLFTSATTSVSATVTVTYTYIPKEGGQSTPIANGPTLQHLHDGHGPDPETPRRARQSQPGAPHGVAHQDHHRGQSPRRPGGHEPVRDTHDSRHLPADRQGQDGHRGSA
jgi:hypothetical protein